jgi:hypothetical protein
MIKEAPTILKSIVNRLLYIMVSSILFLTTIGKVNACIVRDQPIIELKAESEVVILATILSSKLDSVSPHGKLYKYNLRVNSIERGVIKDKNILVSYQDQMAHMRGEMKDCPRKHGSGIEYDLKVNQNYKLYLRSSKDFEILFAEEAVKTIKEESQAMSENKIKVSINGDYRILDTNGISKHSTGKIPPLFDEPPSKSQKSIFKRQKNIFKIPTNPQIAASTTPLGMGYFGLGVNGYLFDRPTPEWYLADRQSGWQYEPFSEVFSNLALDENNTHVQPSATHSPIIGWAADGFPIYSHLGYKEPDNENSAIIEKSSSYRLKKGKRPVGAGNPGGNYDGTFIADYEYIKGTGSLDECNGQITRTPEFPNGTYAYFLTRSFPMTPRCFKGVPSKDFSFQHEK